MSNESDASGPPRVGDGPTGARGAEPQFVNSQFAGSQLASIESALDRLGAHERAEFSDAGRDLLVDVGRVLWALDSSPDLAEAPSPGAGRAWWNARAGVGIAAAAGLAIAVLGTFALMQAADGRGTGGSEDRGVIAAAEPAYADYALVDDVLADDGFWAIGLDELSASARDLETGLEEPLVDIGPDDWSSGFGLLNGEEAG